MRGRHVAPRHKSPRSLTRTLGRFAVDVRETVPSLATSRAAALMGVAGLAAGTGLLAVDNGSSAPVAATSVNPSPEVARQAQTLLAARAGSAINEFSRSAERPPLPGAERAVKTAALPVSRQDVGGVLTKTVAPATPREIAMSLLSSYGWDSAQFSCLDAIWTRESDWDPSAENSSSGAYGIPQALPGSKMATAGGDWSSNPETQIKWGLSYIRASYGSPCGAWSFWESHSWY